HLLLLLDLALQAALRRQRDAAAEGAEAPLVRVLVEGDERLRVLAHLRDRARRLHLAATARRVQIDPAVLHRDRLLGGAGGRGRDDEQRVRAHRVQRAVLEVDLRRAGLRGAHVVAGVQLAVGPRLLPRAAVAAPHLDLPLDGDEARLPSTVGRRDLLEDRGEHVAAAARVLVGLREVALLVLRARLVEPLDPGLELTAVGAGLVLVADLVDQPFGFGDDEGRAAGERLAVPGAVGEVADDDQGERQQEESQAPDGVDRDAVPVFSRFLLARRHPPSFPEEAEYSTRDSPDRA